MWLNELSIAERRAPGSVPAVPAAEMDGPAVVRLTVDKHASRAFARTTGVMRGFISAPDQDPTAWSDQGAAALERADPELVRSLRSAAASGHPVIVVHGLPVTRVPPATPYDGIVDLGESYQAIVNLHAVLGCLDLHPIAYARENTSTLHAVCPVTRARGEVSSHGFDAALPFHTDYADRPIDEPVIDQSPAAAALAFAVERAENMTPMECVATRRLLAMLTPEQIHIGRCEEFAVRAPDIFAGHHTTRVRRLFLSGTGPDVRCRLNLGKMSGSTPRAARLLHEIRDILSDESIVEQIHVRRGDIVIMDNQRTIHRRAAFSPRWDGTDRYFIRMSAARDKQAGLPPDSRQPWVWS